MALHPRRPALTSSLPENVSHINSIWKKEKSPEQWKEFITVTVYTKGSKTEQ
jgi:hypothetical protein